MSKRSPNVSYDIGKQFVSKSGDTYKDLLDPDVYANLMKFVVEH